ncbi:MAG: diaminopimelate decarboxylase [Gammaproteobacteria bacterium]
MNHGQPFWWQREDLKYQDDRLQFAGYDVNRLAGRQATPSFFYHGQRVLDNVSRLHAALQGAGFADRYRILYAMKANRFAPLLTLLKTSGLVGIDACSPNEVEHALGCGFRTQEISFTNTSLSRQDLQRLSVLDGLSMNCDSLHAIRHWGELGRGRDIGIRVNPAVGIGRADNDKLQYSGAHTTKFGIYKEQFAEAIALAQHYDLRITKIHFHTGCGYLTAQLPCWEGIIQECLWFVDQLDTVETVNVGGGLGVPHVADDQPLDLTQWAQVLARHFLSRPLRIEVEPGDYLVKDSGLLVLTVNSVELKKDRTFVGVNAGFNLAVEPAVYGLPFHPVPARLRPGAPQTVSIAGNINEALDIWYHDIDLPPLREDDCLVLLNAGAYSSSMSSNHCMRGDFREFLLLS